MKHLASVLAITLLVVGCSSNSAINIVKEGTIDFDKSITVGNALDKYKYFYATKWSLLTDEKGRTIVDFIGKLDVDKLANASHWNTYDIDNVKKWLDSRGMAEAHIQFWVNTDKKGFQVHYEGISDNGSDSPMKIIDTIYANKSDTFVRSISRNVQLIKEKQDRVNRDFIEAAAKGDLPAVKGFIANGADVNAKENDGLTALMLASFNDYKEIVAFLLANGADVNAKENDGLTALMLAPAHDDKEIVAFLLANGADVNAKENDGTTALMLASANGHKEIVAFLLANGADVNAKENDGTTALMLASANGHKEVVEFLLANGADVNTKKNDGLTALMLASQEGNNEVKTLLIKAGAK